uniref:Uncharacterized protein n=1 Tax=Spongospora subterranea TaxID=70186 RepID=A0A0H5QN65_9EUKA|eukprot:CRZ02801.1 hypothetical protein [Spongospora subterranea]
MPAKQPSAPDMNDSRQLYQPPQLNGNSPLGSSQPQSANNGYSMQSGAVDRNGYSQLQEGQQGPVMSYPVPQRYVPESAPYGQSPYAPPALDSSGPYSVPVAQQQAPQQTSEASMYSPYAPVMSNAPPYPHRTANCQRCNSPYPLPEGASSWRCKSCLELNSLHADQCALL